MSIRTTVTLDEDVVARLKEESRARNVPFRTLLNDVARSGLAALTAKPERRAFAIEPVNLGFYPGLNYDDVGGLLELGEGEDWR